MADVIRRLGAVSARRPWLTIAAWGGLTALLLALASTVGGAFSDDVAAPGSESARAMQLLEERFPAATGGGAMAVFASRPATP